MTDEHLMTINIGGKLVKFSRTPDNIVKINDGDLDINLGKASGKTTLGLAALLAPLGMIEEETHGS